MDAARKHRDNVPWPLTVAAIVLTPWAYVHAILNRTLDDFIRYSSYIAVPLAVVTVVVLVTLWWRDRFRRLSAEEWSILPFTLFVVLLAGVTYYVLAVGLKDAYLWFRAPWESRNLALVVGIVSTALLGGGLFYFRFRVRSLYGVTEALVGLAVAGHRIAADYATALSQSSFYLAVLTAGVYLVVRGLDNVQQGFVQRDPAAVFLLRWHASLKERAQSKSALPA
jgi:hypothetical protein